MMTPKELRDKADKIEGLQSEADALERIINFEDEPLEFFFVAKNKTWGVMAEVPAPKGIVMQAVRARIIDVRSEIESLLQ